MFLWLLPAVVGLGAGVWLLRRRGAERLGAFASLGLVPRLAPEVDPRLAVRRIAVRVIALVLLVLALAGPKWGFHWQEVHREGIDLIVALDTSRSMLATDVKPNRLERAKYAVMDLLPLLQGDRIGLVAFAGTAFLECPLTLDYAAFERSLRAVDVGIIPRGGTAIARAIDTALAGFEARQGKYEAIILITDGEDHEGDVKAAAQRAAEQGVKIYTIGIGTSEGELLPLDKGGFVKDAHGQVVKSRLNDETLKDIALATGGAYVQGLGPSLGLDQVFRDHIATMERRDLASTLERRYEERFQIPLAAVILLLAIEAAMPLRRVAGRTRRLWRSADARARQRAAAAVVLLALPCLAGWFDPPGDRAAEGNALYASGKYDDAASRYGEGLIDAPASPLLQFNLADALYKQGKYDEAIAAFTKVAATGDPQWVGRANYNIGNAQYRLGSNAEASDPQAAITSYEAALASYKRSMVADAGDPDPKANHEFVAKKLAELKKRLEEQKQQQDQQQQQEQQQKDEQQKDQQQKQDDQQSNQQQQDQQQQDQQQKPEQGSEQKQADENQQQQQAAEQPDEKREQQAGGSEQDQQPEEQPQAGTEQPQPGGGERHDGADARDGAGGAAEKGAENRTAEEQAARAVLDTARSEELGPDDVRRPVAVVGSGEPAQDW
jgi:Ca-activated chloride channel family protein